MCAKCGVLLIGSVALPDAETVFKTLARELGSALARIPDGETGERGRWIWWQRKMLLDHPDMELDPAAAPLPIRQWDGKLLRETELVRFKPGVDLSKVHFETGYAQAAIQSFSVFSKLKAQGVIPAQTRFQVSLPTPMAPAFMYVAPGSIPAFLASYERALLADLASITAAIPQAELAIQWDVCQEVLVFENYFPWRPATYKADTFAMLARLGDAVPAGVELGYHLCYGSPADEHLVMPKDLGICVEIANGLLSKLGRRPDFLHVPVPRDRLDDGYFAPLAGLRLPASAQLYLGLVHHADDAGNRERISVARRHVRDFGIATECGWGRTDPSRVPGIIAAHKSAMTALAT